MQVIRSESARNVSSCVPLLSSKADLTTVMSLPSVRPHLVGICWLLISKQLLLTVVNSYVVNSCLTVIEADDQASMP